MSSPDWKFCPCCKGSLVAMAAGRLSCKTQDCGFEHWNNPTPVVAVIAETDDGIVLAHNRAWPPKVMAPITGFVDAHEDAADAARRELKEELGVDAQALELIGVYNFARMNQLIVAFHARIQPPITLGDELDAYRIVPIERVQGWDFGTGLPLRDLVERRQAVAR
jgi:NAD+ diphosphatase